MFESDKSTLHWDGKSKNGILAPEGPSKPPRTGPIINPSPNAAPIIPKFLALFSGIVMSAIVAWATEMFPPVIPSKKRDIKRRGIFFVTIPIAKSI